MWGVSRRWCCSQAFGLSLCLSGKRFRGSPSFPFLRSGIVSFIIKTTANQLDSWIASWRAFNQEMPCAIRWGVEEASWTHMEGISTREGDLGEFTSRVVLGFLFQNQTLGSYYKQEIWAQVCNVNRPLSLTASPLQKNASPTNARGNWCLQTRNHNRQQRGGSCWK